MISGGSVYKKIKKSLPYEDEGKNSSFPKIKGNINGFWFYSPSTSSLRRIYGGFMYKKVMKSLPNEDEYEKIHLFQR